MQTLANGTNITRESTEVRAADPQHRSMVSTTQALPKENHQPFTFVTVEDPVEGTQVTWNSQSKDVRVLQQSPQDQRHGCWQSDSGGMHVNYGHEAADPAPRQGTAHLAQKSGDVSSAESMASSPQREDLGTATIQGVVANGHRCTFATPGGAVGNDQPLVRTIETWFAPSLGIEVRRIVDDPRSGRSDKELVNLDRSEPPASTFQPPDDYQVKTEELHPVACPAVSTP